MNNKDIKLTKLSMPVEGSCVATCVSMVLGLNEADLTIHSDYVERKQSICNIIGSREEDWAIYNPIETAGMYSAIGQEEDSERALRHSLEKGHIHFCQAPSLNVRNAFHMVLVDYRGDQPIVIDPLKGSKWHKEGADIYEKIGSGETDLRIWTVEAIV